MRRNSTLYCLSRACRYLLALFLLFVELPAQTPLQTPEGELTVCTNVIHTVQSTIRCTATRASLFMNSWDLHNEWTLNTKMYSAPLNRRIVDCALREIPNTNEALFAVLLDNGSSEILHVNLETQTVMSRDESYASPMSVTTQNVAKKIVLTTQLFVHIGNTVWRNSRDGMIWQQDTVGLNRALINDITALPSDTIIVATSRGLAQWQSQTASWNRALTNFDSTFSTASVCAMNSSTIYVGTANRGTYRTRDSAKTWSVDTSGIGTSALARFAFAAQTNTVFAVVNLSTTVSALVRKNLNDAAWQRIDSSLNAVVQTSCRINDISADSVVDVATTFGSYSSFDLGRSWKSSSAGIAAEDITGLQFLSSDDMLIGTSLGIFRKHGTWTKVYPSSGFVAGRSIQRVNTPALRLYTQLPSVGFSQGAILVSLDSGLSWQADSVGLSTVPLATGANSLSTMLVDSRAHKYIALSSTLMRIYSSDSWKIDTAGMFLKSSPTGSEICSCLYADEQNTVYAGGPLYTGTGSEQKLLDVFLFRRALADIAWIPDTVGLNRSPITAMLQSKEGLYAASGIYTGNSQLFKKNSDHWDLLPENINAYSDARAMAIDSNRMLYIAYGNILPATYPKPERGVYATHDEGKTWDYAGLDSVMVRGLTARADGMYAYSNRGVYKLFPRSPRAPHILFSTHRIDFGDIAIGSGRDTTITVENIGIDTLKVNALRSSVKDFQAIPQKFEVASLGTHSINISFYPTTRGLIVATIVPECNAEPDSIFVVGGGMAPSDVQEWRSAKLRVYPNPTMQRLTIQSDQGEVIDVEVVNILGTVVFHDEQLPGSSIDIQDLPNGVYTLCWRQGVDSGKLKLLKTQ